MEKYTLELLDTNTPFTSLLFFLSKYLFLSGTHFELNQCSHCGTVAPNYYIDLDEGRIFCKNHARDTKISISHENAGILRRFLSEKYSVLKNVEIEKENITDLIKLFYHFIRSYIGVNITEYIN